MSHQAQPTVSFASRVPAEVDARRRRLQEQIGCTLPDLVDKALRALEHSLNNGTHASNAADKTQTVRKQKSNASASRLMKWALDGVASIVIGPVESSTEHLGRHRERVFRYRVRHRILMSPNGADVPSPSGVKRTIREEP